MAKKYYKQNYQVAPYSKPNKSHQPARTSGRHLPNHHPNPPRFSVGTPFGPNIDGTFGKLHTKGNDATVVIRRSMTYTDAHGNSATARETQYFSSSRDSKSFYLEE